MKASFCSPASIYHLRRLNAWRTTGLAAKNYGKEGITFTFTSAFTTSVVTMFPPTSNKEWRFFETKKKFQQLKTQEIKKQATDKLEGLDSRSSTFQGAAEDAQRSKPLNRELVEAVSAVASSLPRSKEQTESELLAQLRRHEETTDKQRKGGTINIRNVISEMSIKRQSPAQRGVMISNRISLAMEEDGQRLKPERLSSRSFDSRRSLREGKRLNIFTKAPPETESALKTVSSPTIWDLEFAKEIAAVTDQPPRNGFEEMIQWTKEGILWEFPIDNEAGMDDDDEFHEHIFLEKHLKDFPKEGK
ncbi:28S ribosomal protein S31, mitochondrial-like [Aythya fuligula]|uniref:Small ribosomal subunit protein mS31 n=1 Tax=Aythya fuligula TaxID=219594 RepID=A0A6J3EIN6_AYTFU|nr:28S ribosomal protein S31, mitochondrial-like [Aythya fuligula]